MLYGDRQMEEALTYLYLIYQGFIRWVFDDMAIASNVTVGWVAISVIIFGILINSILNIPKGINVNGRQSNSSYNK